MTTPNDMPLNDGDELSGRWAIMFDWGSDECSLYNPFVQSDGVTPLTFGTEREANEYLDMVKGGRGCVGVVQLKKPWHMPSVAQPMPPPARETLLRSDTDSS